MRSERILEAIKDQKPADVGRHAGWGSEEDAHASTEEHEHVGPGMMNFLRYRATDRWWRVGIGFIWIPAIIVAITVEDWLHFPQSVMWISIGVMFVALMTYLLFWDIDRR
jgi:hypothetical protein